jgi:3-hydroxyisobutyrate dehydrogenase-like beta-hydroxyacid dehydrogenase
MSGSGPTVGIVGLGAMGAPMAANLVAAGLEVVAFDLVAPAPEGAALAASVADLATLAEVVVLSLPDGVASAAVLTELLAAEGRTVTTIVDTSTIGPEVARANAERAAAAGVGYVDAPVSGGVAGATARTITVMAAGSDTDVTAARRALDAISTNVIRVGVTPGAGQAVKLANTFLSASALAATSEALVFLIAAGVDPGIGLEVINASSGRSAASADKFPRHVLTGTFDSGFRSSQMAKDLGLYAGAAGGGAVAEVVLEIWRRFAEAEPDADFTRIAAFIAAALGQPLETSFSQY